MAGVDRLISDALTAFGVTEETRLPGGGQKAVVVVNKGSERLVLKVIEVPGSSPDALKRAEREVELLASIANQHVVAVRSDLLELGSPPVGAAWLEECLDGDDLSASLGPQWNWADAKSMALDVATGLGAAHAKRVVHRDLSANNVRRLADGSYKVMDFGFARYTLRSGLTIAGQPGTRGYASPEHLRSYSGVPTAASDVFCVGILLFAALTGDVPIPYRGDDADYIHRLTRVEMDDLESLRPDLSPGQRAVVARCLHPQPARRYLNGSALADALGSV